MRSFRSLLSTPIRIPGVKPRPRQKGLKLTPMGRFIFISAFLLLIAAYLGILHLVMLGVVQICRAAELPRLLGERWIFVPAMFPFPVGLLVAVLARRCGYHRAVRRFIERKGYGVLT